MNRSTSAFIAHLLFAVLLAQAIGVRANHLPCGNHTAGGASSAPCEADRQPEPEPPEPSEPTCKTCTGSTCSVPPSKQEPPEYVEPDENCDGENVFSAFTGNAHRSIADIRLFGSVSDRPLNFTRHSNSRMAPMNNAMGAFGRHTIWSHNHLWHMRNGGTAANGQPSVRIGTPSGADILFTRDATDITRWLPQANSTKEVRQDGNTFALHSGDGFVVRFERRTHTTSSAIFYRLTEVEDVSGNVWSYSYNTPNETIIRQVTDESGRWLKFTYLNVGNFNVQTTNLATLPRNHTQGSWQEVTVSNTQKHRFVALQFDGTDAPAIAELEFYDENNTLITGTVFGSEPLYAPGLDPENAFDGNTATYYRYAYERNGYIGMDTGVGGKRVSRIRYFVPAGVSATTASGTFVGRNEVAQPNNVVKAVEASDGRQVVYDYAVFTDPSGWFRWAVLEKVNYPDTTSADYSYAQTHSYTQPLMVTASDPMLTGSAAQVIGYEYNPDGPIGFIALERNPITGDVIASTAADGAYKPKAVYANGRTVSYEFVNLNGNLKSKSYGPGRTYQFLRDQGGAGHLSQVTDPLGRVTTFTRTPLGNRLSTTLPDGTVRTVARDSRERIVSETLTGPGMAARTTTYTRDSQGRVTRIDHPDTSFETWTYNAFGQPLSHRLRHNEYETWTYTTNGLKQTYTDPGGHTTTYTYNTLDLVETETDALSRVTTYEYNLRGQLVKTIYPDATFTETEYNDDGLVIARSDELGNVWTYGYDEYRRKISETDPLNRTTTYSYESIGGGCSSCNTRALPTLVTSPSGRKTAYQYDIHWNLIAETVGYDTAQAATTQHEYDALNRRVKTIDPLGRQTIQTYDNRDRVATSTNPHGLTTSMTYDGAGNTRTVTAPNTGVSTMTYDLMDHMLTQTDALNQTTTYTYDIVGRQIAVTSPAGRVSTTAYDADSQVIARTSGFGTAEEATTAFEYDAAHRLVKTIDALGRETTFTYDLRDRQLTVTDPLSRVTETGYNDAGRQVFTISASGAQTDYVYDDAGQLRFVTNALDETSEFQYDADGRQISQISPTGKTRQSVYDARGQLFRDILPDGEFTEYVYRADGSLHTRTMPDGSIETRTYGATGLLLSVTWNTVAPAVNHTYDGLARLIKTTVGVTETSWTYDLLDRRITETEHIAGGPDRSTTYTFEPDGMMASLTDGRGNTRQWTYTARGQLFRKTYPDTTFDEYTYRLDGSLNTRKTPAGAVETHTYNAGGLLTSRTWSDATPAVAYTYDAAARPTSVANAASTVSWTYDALDRRASETQQLAGAAARTVGYAYDDDGNLAALGRPDGTVVAYAYNLRDQLTAVTADGPPPLAQYTYDVMGRRTNLLLENGQNTASTFDTAGRLLAHTHTLGGNPLDAVGYTLNANGWRTAIARPGGKDDAYTYDTTGQVLTATAASTAGPTSESFAYDLASNRTASSATPPDGVQGDTPITYAANSLDQYTSLNGQAQTHDANGNTLLLRQPTQDDVTFDWDSENRMLVQERGGSDPARIVNHYDALHRRVRKEIYEKPGGTFVLVKTHTFIYDGWNVIEERQFNAGGTLTALTRLTWGADLSGTMQGAGGVGGLLMAEEMDLADIDPPVAHYYWYDGNGNVTGITDDSGAIEGTYRYTSFGALAEIATTTAFAENQPWKFSTKYHDPEVEPVAGTFYYGYRSYLPSVGRWPSRDPIGERGGVNLYGMIGNDAVNQVDRLGLAGREVKLLWDGSLRDDNLGFNVVLQHLIPINNDTIQITLNEIWYYSVAGEYAYEARSVVDQWPWGVGIMGNAADGRGDYRDIWAEKIKPKVPLCKVVMKITAKVSSAKAGSADPFIRTFPPNDDSPHAAEIPVMYSTVLIGPPQLSHPNGWNAYDGARNAIDGQPNQVDFGLEVTWDIDANPKESYKRTGGLQ